jgi:hypothetical protein
MLAVTAVTPTSFAQEGQATVVLKLLADGREVLVRLGRVAVTVFTTGTIPIVMNVLLRLASGIDHSEHRRTCEDEASVSAIGVGDRRQVLVGLLKEHVQSAEASAWQEHDVLCASIANSCDGCLQSCLPCRHVEVVRLIHDAQPASGLGNAD